MRTLRRRAGPIGLLVVVLTALAAGTSPVRATISWGGGEVTGVYRATPGIPPPGSPCTPLTAAITATSEPTSLGTMATEGEASSGTGCESALVGGGIVTLAVQVESSSGSIYDCPSMTGRYTRLATDFVVVVTGACVVNQFGTGLLNLTLDVTLIPTTSHGWFVGTWAVLPAFEG